MNPTRLALAILAGFAYIFASDFFIHQVLLAADYKASAALWRPEDEIQRRLPIMLFAQLLCALAFVYIWAKTGWRRRSILDGCFFGFWLGAFQAVWVPAMYVVMAMPLILSIKWFIIGIAQAVLLGALTAVVYKPRTLTQQRP